MPAPSQNSSNSDQSDVRYFPRWPVNNRVTYQRLYDKKKYEGQTRDLSCAGACISVYENFEEQENIDLTIHLSDWESISLKGKVVWTHRRGLETKVGIDFIDVDQTAQEVILKHAFDLNRDVLQKYWFNGWDAQS